MTPDDLVAEIPALYRFARVLVRDEHLAADLTQDTLMRAIERSHQYRNDAPLGAWLKRILRNLATDRARRSVPAHRSTQPSWESTTPSARSATPTR